MCMFLLSIGSHLSLPIAHNAHILAASIAAADHSIRFSGTQQRLYLQIIIVYLRIHDIE